MNTKHRKTLRAVFAKPTSPAIVFNDIEALLVALGGQVHEREGSRVKITIKNEQWRCHRPHPGKEAKRIPLHTSFFSFGINDLRSVFSPSWRLR